MSINVSDTANVWEENIRNSMVDRCDNLLCLYGGVITIVENPETEEELGLDCILYGAGCKEKWARNKDVGTV